MMRKSMSKALSLLLALSMVLALAACGPTTAEPSSPRPHHQPGRRQDPPTARPHPARLADNQVFSFILRVRRPLDPGPTTPVIRRHYRCDP